MEGRLLFVSSRFPFLKADLIVLPVDSGLGLHVQTQFVMKFNFG